MFVNLHIFRQSQLNLHYFRIETALLAIKCWFEDASFWWYQPHDGTRGKGGIFKIIGVTHWGPWISVQNFILTLKACWLLLSTCLLIKNDKAASSPLKALNFNGRLKYLRMHGNTGADGRTPPPPQLALFAIATPVEPPSVMEIRTKTLIFETKHRMDFAPVGIDTRLAFSLSARQIRRDGTQPATITVVPLCLCVFRGKLVLGYSEIELVTTGSGYQFIHAADMMYCADNHLRSELSSQLQAPNFGHALFFYTTVSSVPSDEDRR